MRVTQNTHTGGGPQPNSAPAAATPTVRAGVAAFPLIDENPYQRLLYAALSECGLELVPGAHFRLRWLLRARHRVRVLHFHWPQNYYRWWRRPAALGRALSWLKLGLHTARLAGARLAGYRLVWTVHEVFPHERAPGSLDRVAARILARLSHVLIAHDEGTKQLVARELGRVANKVQVIPHGSYIGVYPPGRDRELVRAELGIAPDAFAFLCFGHVRAYKEVAQLLESFAAAELRRAVLVVAGLPLHAETAATVRTAAERDPRIVTELEFIPTSRVAELFDACDAFVLTRTDGGTSGALILSLSLGLPVVAADRPDYAELIDAGRGGWLFSPGAPGGLATALEEAAHDPADAETRGRAAFAHAESLRWSDVAKSTARAMLGDDG